VLLPVDALKEIWMKVGSSYVADGKCEFTVWAPLGERVELRIVSPRDRVVPMEKDDSGYWRVGLNDVFPGTLYYYRLNGEADRPDPASHYQPQGVHGPSQVVDQNSFKWEDHDWKGIELKEMIVYEVHVGAFTPDGSFDAVIPRLDELKDLGVNTLLIMPVAECPGSRNWGYDGVFPYAVYHPYGDPDGFKRLINACHRKGFAVKLDVVYNHMGPEGNYLREYGPYFTDTYRTAWGDAVNVDDAYSDDVRNFFLENALYWFRDFHVDVLRLDAADRIYDINAYPFLQELADVVHDAAKREGKKHFLVAEADQNDPKLIRKKEEGGFGLDGQWCDDFHHCVHTLLTGELSDYYTDFGRVDQLAKSLREGFVFSGEYSPYRKHRRGQSSKDRPGYENFVFSQNHDQVGNRMAGERMTKLTSYEGLKLAAGIVLLSPFVPLLFMGEEYGEESPFLYFVEHSDPELIEAVRKGRVEAFGAFASSGEVPDAEGEEAFLRSKLNWEKRNEGKHKVLLDFYKTLIRLRKETPAFANCDKTRLHAQEMEAEKTILMHRWNDKPKSRVFCVFNFNTEDARVTVGHFLPGGRWKKVLDSSDAVWNGTGGGLPEMLDVREPVLVKGQSLGVYLYEDGSK
jgi:maltooligosyltrehalose trehalohydrolase